MIAGISTPQALNPMAVLFVAEGEECPSLTKIRTAPLTFKG